MNNNLLVIYSFSEN